MKSVLISILLLGGLCSCSYMQHAAVQSEYARIQRAEPGQVNLKHMLDRETYFVFGVTLDKQNRYNRVALAVAAYSDKFRPHEQVDTMYFAGAGTHYGLTLPEGAYQLLVFADLDGSQTYEPAEVVGRKTIVLNATTAPQKVLERVDIPLTDPTRVEWAEAIAPPQSAPPQPSLFFPAGAIRRLDDPIFARNVATLGMYDPASFLERAPTMFYALEEELGYKMPVVFVHGIGGSVRDFEAIVEHLDRDRYKPWFFYYPSGGDLDQLAEMFYRIFLSGRVAAPGEMPVIIISHSMGGLVVREALNRYQNKPQENKVRLWISIASPFGGHPAAATGEKHGLIVLPAWRDVNPENRFIRELYRNPLPPSINHQLLYAFHNPATLKLKDNSDGVVPLSSQLRPEAQKEATEQFGFGSSHTGILQDEGMRRYIFERMAQVQSAIPENHLALLLLGGYEEDICAGYDPMTRYIVDKIGKYAMALTRGEIEPIFPDQETFLRVMRGQEVPTSNFEKCWLKFLQENPTFDRD